jgi:hypothetical protein
MGIEDKLRAVLLRSPEGDDVFVPRDLLREAIIDLERRAPREDDAKKRAES